MLVNITVMNTNDDGPGSLRDAIIQANDNNNQATTVDNIRFDNSVKNQVINLNSALPAITEPTNIQVDPFFPFDTDTVTIRRNASFIGPGLDFNVPNGPSTIFMTIQGLTITNFNGHGITVLDLPDATNLTIHLNVMDNNTGDGIHINMPTGTDIDRYTINDNVITNNFYGIRVIDVDFAAFSIFSNHIGTDGSSVDDGNASHGIYISDSFTSPLEEGKISTNTISGNGGDGIRMVDSSASNSVYGIRSNTIGLNVTETSEIANAGTGVTLLRSRTPIASNTIGGNLGSGIVLDDSDLNTVSGNRIGTKLGALGTDFGNAGHGIQIIGGSQENTIGTVNFIHFNGGDGIEVSGTTTVRNEITQNEFRANGGTAIDLLGANGPSDNDSNDGDTGGNTVMNHPIIDYSRTYFSGSQWTVAYSFDVDVAGNYRFEFYRYDPLTLKHTFVNSVPVNGVTVGTTDFKGTVTLQNGTEMNEGDRLAVLAVRVDGTTSKNTSELSASTSMIIGTPRVTDVRLNGLMPDNQPWLRGPYSYASIVPTGKQALPINTGRVNTIQVVFSEHVNLDGSDLSLYRTSYTGIEQEVDYIDFLGIDPNTHIATWVYPELSADKYRIDLSAEVTDMSGNMLDGEWHDPTTGTPDNFADDLGKSFPTGDGTPGTTGNEFQFVFSILPGDSNQDGFVTAADTSGTIADVDGDGTGEMTDDVGLINTTYINSRLPGRRTEGDYVDDDIVDMEDYLEWRKQYGQSGPNLSADGNQDGTVDVADFVVVQQYIIDGIGVEFRGAWKFGQSGFGAVLPLQQINAAPTVVNVTISGSNSIHNPFSFTAVDGSGEQLRTVPVGGADTISITFSEDVNVVASNLRLVGLSTANVPTLADFSYDIATVTATWRFDDLVANDHYAISLSDAVTDIQGNLLDGEWVNPASVTTTNAAVSEFPSGDGEAGGDFLFVMTMLSGDANLSVIVDFYDFQELFVNYGATSGMQFSDGDFDGDGDVDFADYTLCSANYTTDLQSISLLADLNGDFAVDNLDADILDEHWWDENPTYEDGDLNEDGDVNADDVDLFFAQHGLALSVAS